MTIYLWEQIHRYHKNWFGSKYKVSMQTFCVFFTLWRSKYCSICSNHDTGSLPSNFIILIFVTWWVFDLMLEFMKSWLTFILFSSSVSFSTLSLLVSIYCRHFVKFVFNSFVLPLCFPSKPSILSSTPCILAFTSFILASMSFILASSKDTSEQVNKYFIIAMSIPLYPIFIVWLYF